MKTITNYIRSLFLFELLKGLGLTGSYFSRAQVHAAVPGAEGAGVAAFPRPACAAPLSER